MDFTAIRNDSNTEGRIFQGILPHTDTKSASADFLDRKYKKESDALSAIKIDPAVLEAQVTIDRSEKNKYTAPPFTKKTKESERRINFEKAMSLQRAAIMSLSGQQFHLLLRYVDTLRSQRQSLQRQLECAFCKNNGEPPVWYTTHALKDGNGRVRCPVLRAFTCRRCGATGDHAHTIKYCPDK